MKSEHQSLKTISEHRYVVRTAVDSLEQTLLDGGSLESVTKLAKDLIYSFREFDTVDQVRNFRLLSLLSTFEFERLDRIEE